jgi:hypothetical protein
MTADPDKPQPPSGDRGVFGNLPNARPGVRSPRRDSGKRGSAPAPPKRPQSKGAKVKPPASPGARSAGASAPRQVREASPSPPRRTSAEPPRAASPAQSAAPERGGVEEVAWAGITVAAEAATLGVRLISRALEAVRERR